MLNTETVKILLRSNGDAAEPKRKVDAAMKASAIVPTKQVRRLEFQIEDLEKQLGASETARETLAEEAGDLDAFDPTLSKAEASLRIDALQEKTGRGTDG